MVDYTRHRGNPEQKLAAITSDFSGGINTVEADDSMQPDQLRYAYNYSLDQTGDLKLRETWEKDSALTEVLDKAMAFIPYRPDSLIRTRREPLVLHSPVWRYTVVDNINMTYFNKDTVLQVLSYYDSGPNYDLKLNFIETLDGVEIGKTLIAENLQNRQHGTLSNNKLTREYRKEDYIDEDGKAYTSRFELTTQALAMEIKYSKMDRVPSVFIDDEWVSNMSKGLVTTTGLFKVVKNDSNVFGQLANTKTYQKFAETMNEGEVFIFRYVHVYQKEVAYNAKKNTMVIEIVDVKLSTTGHVHEVVQSVDIPPRTGGIHMIRPYGLDSEADRFLGNIHTGTQGKWLVFTANDVALIAVDMEATKTTAKKDAFRFYATKSAYAKGDLVNRAYKPSPQDIRRIGFNVLGGDEGTKYDPLQWLKPSPTTIPTVEGVYLTTKNREPVQAFPLGVEFQINIMFTGGIKDFKIEFFNGTSKDEDKKPLEATFKKSTLSSSALYITDVTMKAQPTKEVEIVITSADDEKLKYYDYYTPQTLNDDDLKKVTMLDVEEFGLAQIWDRMVYFKGNSIWFSEAKQFDYVPNSNYVNLPITAADEIVSIKFFRTSYIVFTRERIYKLLGMFGSNDFGVQLITDELGCVAPYTIQMMSNKLYFLSSQGVYRLKTEQFRENLENLEKVDYKVKNFVPKHGNVYSLVDGDKYTLLDADATLDFERKYIDVDGRQFPAPDFIMFYEQKASVMFGMFDIYNKPTSFIEVFGIQVARHGSSMLQLGQSHTENGKPVEMYIETFANNMNYPLHEKKFKILYLKFGGEAYQQPIELDVYIDGMFKTTKTLEPEYLISEYDFDNSRHHIRKIRIPSMKGKNIALVLKTTSAKETSLIAITYEFKLGKMRERRSF